MNENDNNNNVKVINFGGKSLWAYQSLFKKLIKKNYIIAVKIMIFYFKVFTFLIYASVGKAELLLNIFSGLFDE